MSAQRPTASDALDLLAAEYVIGLTDPADLQQVESMILRDPAFAAAISAWRARFAPIDAAAPPAEAGDALWSSIEGALGAPVSRAASPLAGAARPVAAPVAAPKPAIAPTPVLPPAPAIARPAARPQARPGLWDSLAFWRVAGLSGAFAALLLAAGLAYTWRLANRQPVLIAVLMTDGSTRPAAIVHAFADGRAEMIPLADIAVPEGRAIEIWTLWDRAVGPRSVGLIQRVGKTALKLEGLPKPSPGQIFEMTLEPAGGSPTGRPTGPILNKGEATTAL